MKNWGEQKKTAKKEKNENNKKVEIFLKWI